MIVEENKPGSRQEFFIELYETAFPHVASFIHKLGGSLDEAKDVFQDALVIYYEKSIEADFIIPMDKKAYLAGICRHLWYGKHRENARFQKINLIPEPKLTEEQEPHVSESILHFIEHSGKKCLALLQAFYYDKLNMKALAGKFNFSSERSATVQKYKCLEKVRMAIREQSLNKADFYE